MEHQDQPNQPNGSKQEASTAIVRDAGDSLDRTAEDRSRMMSPFASIEGFDVAQRMAKALAASSMVPKAYINNVPNCMIAMEAASRVGVSVLAVMQNLDIIHGMPSWRAKFLIASINASGRFTPLRYEWAGEPGKRSWACRAKARSKEDGELCLGSWITWEMVDKEGWAKKNGSKWQTMPEQMFMYRAASFWQRSYCPEISLGFHTSEEAQDIIDARSPAMTSGAFPDELAPQGAQSLEAVLGLQRGAQAAVVDTDGEPVTKPETPVDATPKTAASDEPAQQSLDTGKVKR